MRRLALVFVAICTPLAALSQQAEFSIDYEALFQLHPDRIAETDRGDFQVLNMPGGIVVDRRGELGNYRYSGTDTSDGGAVGCYAMYLIEHTKRDAFCPGIMSDDQSAQLEDGLERVLRFYAENQYPAVSYEALDSYVRLQLAAEWLNLLPNSASFCEQDPFLSGFIDYYDGMSDGAFQRDLDKILEVPRLPVNNPCV